MTEISDTRVDHQHDLTGFRGGPATRMNPPECPDCRALMARSSEAIMMNDVSAEAWGCMYCDTHPTLSRAEGDTP